MKAVREMNGKFVSGSVLLVSLLEPGSRSEDSKKEVKEVDEIAGWYCISPNNCYPKLILGRFEKGATPTTVNIMLNVTYIFFLLSYSKQF